MIKETLKEYTSYRVLAEDASTLEFKQINNINLKEIEKNWQLYEVDHTEKVIYLELIDHKKYILIASGDYLELPLEVVANLNQAAEFMGVNSTHLYRAYRRAGRPEKLIYKDYILIKI